MRTDLAFELGELNRGKPEKVFDWYKAVNIISDLGFKNAYAGLGEDWFWTGGQILKDKKPYTEDYTFLSSTWATPIIIGDDDQAFECWCWKDDCVEGWDSDTKWPTSARLLMEGINGILNK